MSFHEDIRRPEEVRLPSNRSFGFVFAVVFLIVGFGWPVIAGKPVYWWSVVVGGLFFLLGAFNSPVLTPLNRLWMRFGLLLHRIVSPVVLGVVFFVTVTPIGWIMRLTGYDPMRRRFDKEASSYWIARRPAGPSPESMRNQF